MTLDEYRLALTTLSPEQWATFARWSGAAGSIDGNLEAFAQAADRDRYERMAIFHLRAAGVGGVMTESEKTIAIAADAAYAAKVSAIAAERAALSAWWSITAAVLAVVALAVQYGCWIGTR